MANSTSRRNFLRSASIAAAAASLPLTGEARADAPSASKPEPFQLFTAAEIVKKQKDLHTKPGNDNLFTPTTLPLAVVLTVEEKKSAKEFEWHEGRDHVVQILEGSTVYEVGGTPVNGRNTKPGEWLAPTSTGATTYTLHKGDMLIIPRNTPHKRNTADSVTIYLISSPGEVKA